MTAQRQIVSIGNQFTGVAPGGAATTSSGMTTYAANASGGLFDLDLATPAQLVGFELIDGGQSSWTLRRVYADASVGPILYSGTTGDAVTNAGQDDVWLTPGQKLKLETTGATTEISAAIYYRVVPE